MANRPNVPQIDPLSHQSHNNFLSNTSYQPTTTDVSSPTGGAPSSGRHPVYRGIRCRSRKWVSEIREPRKTTRIWLGTYPTPEMAAAAYDVAALALKGPDAAVNFPEFVGSYPTPASQSASDIRSAAASAAAARAPPQESGDHPVTLQEQQTQAGQEQTRIGTSSGVHTAAGQQEFVYEGALFDYPNLLMDMAEGMLVSPPRMKNTGDDGDSPDDLEPDNLWGYP
ncbi:Ethylene-responsive transcription factor [Abeliophyllum distichum]|uniref:Ethylene-responsive transcription factor n=1 Tax=Abeliophyllum distichum TaxID=126358 RepID=A0ABD1VRW8_9LAMI